MTDKTSERGSYCQLNTYEDNNIRLTSSNGRERRNTGSKTRLLVQRRTLFTKRDCILVSVIMVAVIVAIAVTLGIGLPRLQAKREKYLHPVVQSSPSQLYSFNKAAVLSDGAPCAAIGRSMLEKGGSAVDAAIAMVFCGGVVNPTSTGLGGGFLMTVYNSSAKKAEVVDAREEAPSGASVDMFHGNNTLSSLSGSAIAVPGELKGLWLAHQRYGHLNWSELVLPSVKLCQDGFRVSTYLASKIQAYSEQLLADPGLRDQFVSNQTGELIREGDLLKRHLYGETLSKVAADGPDALYTGQTAETIAKEIQGKGGIVTMQDLANYTAKIREPISLPLFGGQDMFYSVPPPGSGAVLAAILNILVGYNFTSASVSDVDSTVLTYHRMIEAFKHAFAERSRLGDTDYVNVTKILSNLTNPQFGAQIRSRITDDATHPLEYYDSAYFAEDHGTSHCQVLSANGDAVSVTSTINQQFGALFASPSTGIIFNNEMDDFSSPNMTNYFGVAPSEANYISPGKRPLSSMSPSIVVNQQTGKIRLVLGANGGTRIITSIAQVLSQLLWFDRDVKTSIDTPRFHHQLYPDYLQIEENFQEIYKDKLENLGHQTITDPEGSVVLGIVQTNSGEIQANVDYRKGGSAEGL